MKGTNQSTIFLDFWVVWSKHLSFLKQKSVFLQIMHLSSVSRDTTPLYFLAEILYTFNKRSKSKHKFVEISPEQLKVWLVVSNKYDMRNLVNFHPHTQESKNFTSMGHFCPKYMRFDQKIQKIYLSWHGRVMQNLNKVWPCGFKNGMKYWVNFH